MKRVLLGIITGVHGIKGEVVIQSFTADPLDIDAYGPLADADGARGYEIETARPASKGVIARLKGISDRSAAERLKGTELYVDRDRLPATEDEDEFYHTDLVGLAAQLADGTPYGRVVALPNYGAGDLIEIAPAAGGQTLLLPFTREAVPTIDLTAGFLVVVPPEEIEARPEDEAEPGAAD